ncbi:MAG: hypothetical protein JSW27_02155 [Phycisphaerales bacterium]|nr:MAG: hypothetical protein JSW27_02155 [Phycisphaerales bacterium]
MTGVTNKWAKQRKAEEREARRVYNRRYVMTRSWRITIKEVAEKVMEEAYLKASSDGQYPAHARQIMYAARPQILARADVETLNDAYFTQQLLPNYMESHPETAAWDVVFDARGHFYEPHTEKEVALGTLAVRRYLRQIATHEVSDLNEPNLGETSFPTQGPSNRYGAILFIEKEGFLPLFDKARLAERYDIAIMSTKGMSNTASRHLVDTVCSKDVPLLVLHDFDKSGFSILGTLQRDTRRYSFDNDVHVIDLGLRLDDVVKWDLQPEECTLGKSDPTRTLRKNGATKEEIKFLCRSHSYWGYRGQRVELNAFTSGDMLTWIEAKLKEHGITKVIPDDEVIGTAYRRAALRHDINEKIEALTEDAREEIDAMTIDADEIRREVQQRLERRPEQAWDQAISDIAAEGEL